MSIISIEKQGRRRTMITNFFEHDKQFIAIYDTELGTFSGVATYNPSDVFNAGIGSNIATNRAYKKYYKACKAKIKTELNTLLDFYSGIQDMKAYDEKNPIVSKLRRAIYEKQEALDIMMNSIKLCDQAIERAYSHVKERDECGSGATPMHIQP